MKNKRPQRYQKAQPAAIFPESSKLLKSTIASIGNKSTTQEVVAAILKHQLAIAIDQYNYNPRDKRTISINNVLVDQIKDEIDKALETSSQENAETITEEEMAKIVAKQLADSNLSLNPEDRDEIVKAVVKDVDSTSSIMQKLLAEKTDELKSSIDEVKSETSDDKISESISDGLKNAFSNKTTANSLQRVFDKTKTMEAISKQISNFSNKQLSFQKSFSKSFIYANKSISSAIDKLRNADGSISAINKAKIAGQLLSGKLKIDPSTRLMSTLPMKYRVGIRMLQGVQKVTSSIYSGVKKILTFPFKAMWEGIKNIGRDLKNAAKTMINGLFFNFIKTPAGMYTLGWLIGYAIGKIKKMIVPFFIALAAIFIGKWALGLLAPKLAKAILNEFNKSRSEKAKTKSKNAEKGFKESLDKYNRAKKALDEAREKLNKAEKNLKEAKKNKKPAEEITKLEKERDEARKELKIAENNEKKARHELNKNEKNFRKAKAEEIEIDGKDPKGAAQKEIEKMKAEAEAKAKADAEAKEKARQAEEASKKLLDDAKKSLDKTFKKMGDGTLTKRISDLNDSIKKQIDKIREIDEGIEKVKETKTGGPLKDSLRDRRARRRSQVDKLRQLLNDKETEVKKAIKDKEAAEKSRQKAEEQKKQAEKTRDEAKKTLDKANKNLDKVTEQQKPPETAKSKTLTGEKGRSTGGRVAGFADNVAGKGAWVSLVGNIFGTEAQYWGDKFGNQDLQLFGKAVGDASTYVGAGAMTWLTARQLLSLDRTLAMPRLTGGAGSFSGAGAAFGAAIEGYDWFNKMLRTGEVRYNPETDKYERFNSRLDAQLATGDGTGIWIDSASNVGNALAWAGGPVFGLFHTYTIGKLENYLAELHELKEKNKASEVVLNQYTAAADSWREALGVYNLRNGKYGSIFSPSITGDLKAVGELQNAYKLFANAYQPASDLVGFGSGTRTISAKNYNIARDTIQRNILTKFNLLGKDPGANPEYKEEYEKEVKNEMKRLGFGIKHRYKGYTYGFSRKRIFEDPGKKRRLSGHYYVGPEVRRDNEYYDSIKYSTSDEVRHRFKQRLAEKGITEQTIDELFNKVIPQGTYDLKKLTFESKVRIFLAEYQKKLEQMRNGLTPEQLEEDIKLNEELKNAVQKEQKERQQREKERVEERSTSTSNAQANQESVASVTASTTVILDRLDNLSWQIAQRREA